MLMISAIVAPMNGRCAVTQMHRLLGMEDECCQASGMRANIGIGKAEMMLFGISAARRVQLHSKVCVLLFAQPIRFVIQYKY